MFGIFLGYLMVNVSLCRVRLGASFTMLVFLCDREQFAVVQEDRGYHRAEYSDLDCFCPIIVCDVGNIKHIKGAHITENA